MSGSRIFYLKVTTLVIAQNTFTRESHLKPEYNFWMKISHRKKKNAI